MTTTEREGFDLPSWKFRVTRLGCVESGEIEVKPLTLLCGPNNTGKTWVMYALYGFLNDLTNGMPPQLLGLDNVFNELDNSGECSWDFYEWLNGYYHQAIELLNDQFWQRLPEIFNAEKEIFDKARFEWVWNRDVFVENAVLNFQRRSSGRIAYIDRHNVILKKEERENYREFISVILFWQMIGSWSVLGNVFLMPAERNGLSIFFRELSDYRTSLLHPKNRSIGLGLKASFDVSNKSKIKLASYAEPIADYIDWLNALRKNSKEKSSNTFDGLSSQIKKLAGGSYEVDAEGDISFMPRSFKAENNRTNKLDLHLASSTVKSLFGLWFYLEHQAKPGDVLMIDEPELNLHPANQRAVARVLARLVNAGIRVVCSTHSDYIVREINSLIMLSRPHPKREELMQRFGYEEEELLKPEQVGAYVFENGRIDAMPITEDEGIEAKTFDQQIHELNETSDEIYYTYRDSGAEDEA